MENCNWPCLLVVDRSFKDTSPRHFPSSGTIFFFFLLSRFPLLSFSSIHFFFLLHLSLFQSLSKRSTAHFSCNRVPSDARRKPFREAVQYTAPTFNWRMVIGHADTRNRRILRPVDFHKDVSIPVKSRFDDRAIGIFCFKIWSYFQC